MGVGDMLFEEQSQMQATTAGNEEAGYHNNKHRRINRCKSPEQVKRAKYK
jgi:hypothetical protein